MTSHSDPLGRSTVQAPGLRKEDLLAIFVSRDRACERVGLELEKFGTLAGGLSLPVVGPRSIRTLLERLERERGWRAEREGEWIVALKRRGLTISVEPGGQLELSTPPAVLLDEAFHAEREHLMELEDLARGWGVSWSAAGVRPNDPIDSIGWVPKRRYLVMRDHLGRTGKLAHWMMKMTASLQVSVDYVSQADAALKLRVLARSAPLLAAMSAASPIVAGKPSGYQSYRTHIWTQTDPARCGLPDCFFKDDFKFEDYVDYALAAPPFYIERQGRLIQTGGLTFGDFLRNGHLEHSATREDWARHLTFLFPEVRLKDYIEVRCCDRQPGTASFGLAAFIKGLIYSKSTLARADEKLAGIGAQAARDGLAEAARSGLEGTYAGRKIREWAVDLLALGVSGLDLLREAERASDLEREWLNEVATGVLRKRRGTADAMLKAWEGNEPVERVVRL